LSPRIAGPVGQTGATGPAGPQGPPGPGHITIYNIPYGHDGWVADPNEFDCQAPPVLMCHAGPYTTTTTDDLGVISGSDLGNITSQSHVMAQQINSPSAASRSGNAILTPTCYVWNPFPGGFHAFCPDIDPQVNPQASLRVVVVNP